jgi:hypothetical protein
MKYKADLTQQRAPGSLHRDCSASYRLLSNADEICPGDERLCDDCKTWETLGEDDVFFGQKYDGNFFVPMRRMTPNSVLCETIGKTSNEKTLD